MPIYVYRNLTTGDTFEVVQRMTDAALTQHPETGDPVKRLIQPVGISFKGSGFYATDSRSPNPASAKSNGSTAQEGAKASDASDGSAAAAKSESAGPSKDNGKSESNDKSKSEGKSGGKTGTVTGKS